MSTRHRSISRRTRRMGSATGALVVAGLALSLLLVPSAGAQPPPVSIGLSAGEARATGRSVGVAHHRIAGADLVEVTPPQHAPPPALGDDLARSEVARREAMRLLDVSSDGFVALADLIGDPEGGLTIVAADGGQAHVALHGVAAAAFAPGAAWLAAVDAAGRVWRIDRASGSAAAIADGPFAGDVSFARDGQLLLVQLSSEEAPYASALVRLDPGSGISAPIAVDGASLVLAARELEDASLLVVVHAIGGGTEVRRVTGESSVLLARLDPDAVDIAISDDGTAVAYAIDGGSHMLTIAGNVLLALGEGQLPRPSPDGEAAVLVRDGRSVIVTAAGGPLDAFASPLAAWAPCAGGCRP